MKACEKRPVSLMQLEQIVDNVEQKVFGSLESEVSSKVIGELVMEQLRKAVSYTHLKHAHGARQVVRSREIRAVYLDQRMPAVAGCAQA